ncbi:MAG: WbqC family protein [Bacteroidetes bacterium]|nr:WbqC family protein [Bacteroidota bacterium]
MDQQSHLILPAAYLPSVSYFALLNNAQNASIEQFETYPKQTYRNRCEIYTEKGKTSMVIPVSKPHGNHTKTADVEIFNQDRWYVKHWRAIESAYRASPYFLYYKDELKSFYDGSHKKLLEFDMDLISHFCKLFDIHTSIGLSSDYIKDTGIDYRQELSPKKPPIIQDFPEYTQVFEIKHGFIPNLSILDLLFNLGPESGNYIYKLGESFPKHA